MKRYIFASNAVYMYRIIISFLLGCIFSSSFSLAQSSTNLPKKTEFVMILSSYARGEEYKYDFSSGNKSRRVADCLAGS